MKISDFAALDRESYINLATFRRDGRAVRTPVWFARRDAHLYVFTERSAGKVKRLRGRPRAQVAACTVFGSVRGEWQDARGRVVDDPDTEKLAYAALHAKYGWRMATIDLFARLAGRIDGRAILELAPAGAGGSQ